MNYLVCRKVLQSISINGLLKDKVIHMIPSPLEASLNYCSARVCCYGKFYQGYVDAARERKMFNSSEV